MMCSVDETNDTHPVVEAIMIEAYRRMTPTEKMARVAALNRMVVQLAMSDVRARHPEADEHEVRLRVASRWLGPKLMVDAFGWDVAEKGY
jgi:hypothetical protein